MNSAVSTGHKGPEMLPSLDIRTYHGECVAHQHGFAQLVLPVRGRMEIEVQGRGACLDLSLAALVAPDAVHSQVAEVENRFLVVDCPPGWLEGATMAALMQRTYVPISASTRRLLEFADLVDSHELVASSAQLVPLLLNALARDAGQRATGMELLLAQLEANPGALWSNDAMARVAGISLSQLHKRFSGQLGETPQAWLADLRLREARKWLAQSNLPIAEIALRAGYCDQAALTRAMSRRLQTTPAAYRRDARQSG